jgi:glutamyl-tRNA synthetase
VDAVRTRFAPSPTGDLHLGGAFSALAAWALARQAGGRFVLRVEDIDRPRVVAGAEPRQLDDLRWLGLTWDEGPDAEGPVGPYRQSERGALYRAALEDLTAQGRTYPCDCSRAEIARVASAPHQGEEVAYPGTCRDKSPGRSFRRSPAIRLRLEATDEIPCVDRVVGPIAPSLLHATGDFVLQRGDGVFAYQVAVSADDLAMGITDVVRGSDLVPSTPRQILLMQLWKELGRLAWAAGARVPRYWHLPLVAGPDGSRLAKRTPGATVRDLREAGIAPEVVIGHLAEALGLSATSEAIPAADLARRLPATPTFQVEPWRIPATWPS